MADWIDDFMEYSKDLPSPENYRLWTAISILGSAAEQRLHCLSASQWLYPNLFVILVGDPGTGKNIIRTGMEFLTMTTTPTTPGLHVANGQFTKASFLDRFSLAVRQVATPALVQTFHYLTACQAEMSTWLPAYDLGYMGLLSEFFDARPFHEEKLRGRDGVEESLKILNPLMSMLCGAQPGYLSTYPESAWTQGMTTRFIMIYSSAKPYVDPFSGAELNSRLKNDLAGRLRQVLTKVGRINYDAEFSEWARQWHKEGMQPEPQHNRLVHYNNRRIMQFLKLCMISVISRGIPEPKTITLADGLRAKKWLLDAEAKMPDIFADMHQHPDAQILIELHEFVWRQFAVRKAPIPKAEALLYLSGKMPSDKAERLFVLAVKSGRLNLFPGKFPGDDETITPNAVKN